MCLSIKWYVWYLGWREWNDCDTVRYGVCVNPTMDPLSLHVPRDMSINFELHVHSPQPKILTRPRGDSGGVTEMGLCGLQLLLTRRGPIVFPSWPRWSAPRVDPTWLWFLCPTLGSQRRIYVGWKSCFFNFNSKKSKRYLIKPCNFFSFVFVYEYGRKISSRA